MDQSLRFMLDANTALCIITGHPVAVRERLCAVPMSSVCISTITQAELLFGVEQFPENPGIWKAVREFLLRVDILPWDCGAAQKYAQLRTACERDGTPMAVADMLIAAHSVAAGAVLVTSNRSFYGVKEHLSLSDWTQPQSR